MSKEIVEKIPVSKDIIDYLQSVYEDYKAKQDLITMIFEIHKNDEDDTIIDSKPFSSYEKKFMKIKIEYDTIMKELQENYIPEKYKKGNYRFEVNFGDGVLEIY